IRSLFALAALPAAASATIARPSLHVEPAAIAAGEPFWAAVRLQLPDGWHVYWKNPGDSGTAPKLVWTLPAGFQAGPIAWAAPRRIPVGPLVNYGYEHEAVFLARVEPPPALDRSRGRVELRVLADWLVCQEECIPEKQ